MRRDNLFGYIHIFAYLCSQNAGVALKNKAGYALKKKE
jgi:hypothetical protein